jgi:hypothetical protein
LGTITLMKCVPLAPSEWPTDVHTLLAAVGGGDERAPLARPGEDDIARLVAHQQRAHHARWHAGHIDHATLSETWFAPQTSLSLRTATATGSTPTGTEAFGTSPAGVTLGISS